MNIANFVQVKLREAISDSATSIRFDTPVAPFNAPPDPAGRTAYAVLIDNLSAPSKFEIVSYTRVEFNRLRGVTRGVDGTTAQSWSTGAFLAQDIPAVLAESIGAEGSDGEVLKAGTGFSFDSLAWSEIAGKLTENQIIVLNAIGSLPAAEADKVDFYLVIGGGSVNRLQARFYGGGTPFTKTIADDT